MDTHRPNKTKKIQSSFIQGTLPPELRLPQGKEKIKLTSLSNHKAVETDTTKHKKLKNLEKKATIENINDGELLYIEEGSHEDSDFEFSAEIMDNNPRQQSRPQREKGKICQLAIYNWMMRVSTLLKLSKQCFYRGIIVMKKFMYLDQKQGFKVTLSNANLYGLAALLISNKVQKTNGNFLINISQISDQNSCEIDKKSILQCQMNILSRMNFHVANCSIIVESILAVLEAWKEITRHTELSKFSFARFEEMEEYGNTKDDEDNKRLQSNKSLLEVFIYLIDYVMMRKLVELKIKDIKEVDNQSYFQKIIGNVLLHLVSYFISQSHPQLQLQQLKAYRKIPRLLANKLAINRLDICYLQRKSHLLNKKIRALFVQTSLKCESIQLIAQINNEIAKSYCLCNIQALSVKYEDQVAFDVLQRQNSNQVSQQIVPMSRQDEHQTDPFVSQSVPKANISKIKSPMNQVEVDPTKLVCLKTCKICMNKIDLLRGIVNQQFFEPLLNGSHAS